MQPNPPVRHFIKRHSKQRSVCLSLSGYVMVFLQLPWCPHIISFWISQVSMDHKDSASQEVTCHDLLSSCASFEDCPVVVLSAGLVDINVNICPAGELLLQRLNLNIVEQHINIDYFIIIIIIKKIYAPKTIIEHIIIYIYIHVCVNDMC